MSADPSAAVLSLIEAIHDHADARVDDPLAAMDWLPGQHAFLASDAPQKLARWGNQWGGKTTAGLAGVIGHCIGRHPLGLEVPPPPVEWWVVCATFPQSIAIQGKAWDLVPKWALHSDVEFDPVKGFKGRHPAIKFRNGSLIRFKTVDQGGLGLAGATIDGALFDEPPRNYEVFAEVQKRVLRRAGRIWLTLTPINAPTDWLRKMCEEGQVEDHHFKLTPENLVFTGSGKRMCLPDGTPMDADWIQSVIDSTLPWEVPVRVHGEWEQAIEGNVFRAFRADHHVTEMAPVGECSLSLGMDHGTGDDFSQVAYIVAVEDSGQYERIWVLDEYISEGTTTPDMDMAAVQTMLRRHGLEWRHLDYARGDIRRAGRRDGVGRKSNKMMMQALGRLLHAPWQQIQPTIRTVKRGNRNRGSVATGIRYLHWAMVRDEHFYVHPRCSRLIESIQRWDYREDSEWKHAIDALRYALEPWIYRVNKRERVTLTVE